MSLKVIAPFLAKCVDRSDIAKVAVNPLDWIIPRLGNDYESLSFHFFINWNQNPPVVSGPFWLSRLIIASSPNELITAKDEDVLAAYKVAGSDILLSHLDELARSNSTNAECVLLGEMDTKLVNSQSPVWIIKHDNEANGQLSINRITIAGLGKYIESIRKGSAALGSKGLIYGTSAVECWLSRTNNLFPGDCDCLILKNGVPVSIIELKKHTLNDPISNNLASRYYPGQDSRKYDSLFALKRYLEQNYQVKIPLSIIYFATRFSAYRVQVIEKGQTGLRVLRDTNDVRYVISDNNSVSAFGNRILEVILP